MVKKAVLFDLDNTLYDYEAPHKKALKAVYDILKDEINISFVKFKGLYKISKVEIHRELTGSASSHNRVLYFQRLIEKTHNTVDPSMILKLYSAYWDTLLKNMKLGKNVLTTLKELKKRGLKIGIVSDLTTHIQLRKIEKLGITKYIDVLVTSEEAGSEKPHAIMFLLTLNKLDVSPHDVIFVGDNSVNDIEGANAVRIDTVLIKQGSLARDADEDYQKPNFVIRDIGEVLNILDGLEE
jgi:putative hydrolase of the HAD superfamily